MRSRSNVVDVPGVAPEPIRAPSGEPSVYVTVSRAGGGFQVSVRAHVLLDAKGTGDAERLGAMAVAAALLKKAGDAA